MLQAAVHGIRIEGATLYSTTYPCSLCAKMLINCGVVRIVCAQDYPDRLAKEMLHESGVQVDVVTPASGA